MSLDLMACQKTRTRMSLERNFLFGSFYVHRRILPILAKDEITTRVQLGNKGHCASLLCTPALPSIKKTYKRQGTLTNGLSCADGDDIQCCRFGFFVTWLSISSLPSFVPRDTSIAVPLPFDYPAYRARSVVCPILLAAAISYTAACL